MKHYKMNNNTMNKKEFTEAVINYIIKPAVNSVQENLHKNYNIESGDHEDYTGLCDYATELLKSYISELDVIISEPHNFEIFSIHGELHHDSRINSNNWYLQHTMLLFTIDGIKFYVDATCKQFRDLYEQMPEYYIGNKCPNWFYPDKINPAFATKFGNWIDNHIKVIHHDKKFMTSQRIGIISYFQYYIHGKISDKIYYKQYKS